MKGTMSTTLTHTTQLRPLFYRTANVQSLLRPVQSMRERFNVKVSVQNISSTSMLSKSSSPDIYSTHIFSSIMLFSQHWDPPLYLYTIKHICGQATRSHSMALSIPCTEKMQRFSQPPLCRLIFTRNRIFGTYILFHPPLSDNTNKTLFFQFIWYKDTTSNGTLSSFCTRFWQPLLHEIIIIAILDPRAPRKLHPIQTLG